jgi:hypothetical protein
MSPISNAIKLAAMNVKSQTHKIDGKTYLFKTKLTAEEAEKRVAEKKAKGPTITTGDLEEREAESGHLKTIASAIETLKALPEYSTGGYMDPTSGLHGIEEALKKKRFYKEAEHIHKLGLEMPDLLYKTKTKANLTKAYKPVIAYLKSL